MPHSPPKPFAASLFVFALKVFKYFTLLESCFVTNVVIVIMPVRIVSSTKCSTQNLWTE